MQTFTPPIVPIDAPQWFRTYANHLHESIRKAAAGENEYATSKVLRAPPVRYFPGMEVYADGVNWNPGSGEGKYRRNAANTAWVFMG